MIGLRVAYFTYVAPSIYARILMDITARKQAEDALIQVKVALEEAQRLAKVGSWEWEIATDTVTWSRELYRIFSRDPDWPAPTYREHLQIYTAERNADLNLAQESSVKTAPTHLESLVDQAQRSAALAAAFPAPAVEAPSRRPAAGAPSSLADVIECPVYDPALPISLWPLPRKRRTKA